MANAFIAIGSNIQPQVFIPKAIKQLSQISQELITSPFYQTHAIGFVGPDFINAVIRISTTLSITNLYHKLKVIERVLDSPPQPKQPRSKTIDLDLLIYDHVITQVPTQLPRRDIEKFAFVLKPLADIAPQLMHPQLNICYQHLWQNFPNKPTLTPIELTTEI